MSPRSVAFLFDYASPFAYLASETLARKLPGLEVSNQPIYLRGLETFRTGLPYTAAKAMYVVRDYLRCAEHEQVETRIPTVFPINGLYAARGALVATELGGFADYHAAMFRAAFRDDRDISKKDVVVEIARQTAFDGTTRPSRRIAYAGRLRRARRSAESSLLRGRQRPRDRPRSSPTPS